MLHVYVYTCTHAYVEFHVYVYAYAHARMRRLVMVWRWYVRRPWPARGKICACAFLVYIIIGASVSEPPPGGVNAIFALYNYIYVRSRLAL